MLKKDPAFLFYDGDAARDVSHMNRLERGAYFDLIQAQRKFGGYTVEQARKILGKDFDECWPAIELILTKENDKYFISWLSLALVERAEFREKQRKRIQDFWDKKKQKDDSVELPKENHGTTTDIPLEDEDEDENINILKEEFEKFRKQYPGTKRGLDTEYDNLTKKHKNFKEIIPLLSKSLELQIILRKLKQQQKMFVPEWKNLQTWINQKCWEEETGGQLKSTVASKTNEDFIP